MILCLACVMCCLCLLFVVICYCRLLFVVCVTYFVCASLCLVLFFVVPVFVCMCLFDRLCRLIVLLHIMNCVCCYLPVALLCCVLCCMCGCFGLHAVVVVWFVLF